LFIVAVLGISSAFGQTKLADSLTARLPESKGKDRVDVLNNLAYELISYNSEKALKYCDQSLAFSATLDYPRGQAIAYLYKGVCLCQNREFTAGQNCLQKGLALTISIKDHSNEGYALLQLGNSYLNQLQTDSSSYFYNRAYSILKDSADPRLLSELYKNLSALYSISGQHDLQRKFMARCLRIREMLGDKSLLADALIEMASLNIKQNFYDSAAKNLDEAKKLLNSLPDDLHNLNEWRQQKGFYLLKERRFGEALTFFDSAKAYYFRTSQLDHFVHLQSDLGEIFSQRGEYEIALKSYYDALRIAEIKGYDYEIISIYLGLGWVNFNLGEMPQSLTYANLALETARQKNIPNKIAGALNLKGCAQTQLGDLKNAQTSLSEALTIREKMQDKSMLSEALTNLAYLEESKKNYKAAKILYNKSLVFAEQSKYYFGKVWIYLGLGSIHLKEKAYSQSNDYLTLAEKLAKEINVREALTQIYELKRSLFEAMGELDQALKYSKLAYHLNDSLHRSDLSKAFVNLQRIEEIEKRDRDIKILTKDRQLAKDKISLQEFKLRQQYFIIVAIGIGLLLFGTLALVYARFYNQVKRLNSTIQEKNEKLIEQNQLIDTQKEELAASNEKLEGEVALRTQALTNQNLQLEQFAYMTSHNLRAPVARLLGLTQLFNSSDQSDPLNKQLIEMVRTSAQEFDIIMSDLTLILDVKNALNENFSDIDIETCFQEAWKRLADEFDLLNISLSISLNEKTIYGIEPYLISILENLSSNSIKFKKESTPLQISVSSYTELGKVIIEYTDNGMGFDMVQAGANLFKPYKRFHVHNQGKGLGLYMIKLQVEAMGGSIEIRSHTSIGFTCKLSFQAAHNSNQ